MRLRVAIGWAGDLVEDRVHDRRELRVGGGAEVHVSVPGPADAPARFVEVGALVVAELPAALVAEVRWPDGSIEAIDEDRSVTLAGAHRRGVLVLRTTPLPEHPTTVGFALEERLAPRRDVALFAWAGGALALAMYLGAALSFVRASAGGPLAGPRALGEGEAAHLRVTLALDPRAPLGSIGESVGDGGRGRGGGRRRSGTVEQNRYASLLYQGFDRYLAGALDEAAERWQQAAALHPEWPHAWVNLAQVEKRRGALEAERRFLTHALEAAPDHCEALTNLGLVEARQHRYEAGREVLLRARRACGARRGFLLLDEAALSSVAGERDAALRKLEDALPVLTSDAPDKRREALADLERDPLFASLRGEARFRAVLAHLRRSLARAEPV